IGLLVLFGSRARGDARPASDLDLGVERVDGRGMSLREIGLLRDALARLPGIGTTEVDVVDLAAADALLRFEVARQGRLLHEARPGLYRELVGRTLVEHDDIAPFLPLLIAGVGRIARRAAKK